MAGCNRPAARPRSSRRRDHRAGGPRSGCGVVAGASQQGKGGLTSAVPAGRVAPAAATQDPPAPPISPVDLEGVRERVDRALAGLVARRRDQLDFLEEDAPPLLAALSEAVLGPGKRLRPAFVYWGYRAAGGDPHGPGSDRAIRAGCAVELLHGCALTCDDVMDGSRTRRGRPAAHVRFARLHRRERWSGDPEGFGRSVATLLGLLLSGWAEQAVVEAGVPAERLPEVLGLLDLLRTEAIGGQYLDVVQARRGVAGESEVRRAVTYKTAKYTVERPLHLGLAIAGGGRLREALSAYALPLGEAFQLRDDLLGAFGDPTVTGKPFGQDLREGKQTYLLLRARRLAGPAARELIDRAVGQPWLRGERLDEVCALLVECGALAECERRIAGLVAEALAALERAEPPAPARAALTALARYATGRWR
jgi:geranylgeranyl diphosphate synthase, type I